MDYYDEGSVLEKDIKYINKEVLARQKNGKFCKYSRIAKSITATNFTEDQYINYWLATLRNRKVPADDLERVKQVIIEKFENDLTDLSVVIKLENLSNDQKKDKESIIKEITTSK